MENQSRPARYMAHVFEELGLTTMWRSSLDVKLLCAQRFVRLFAYGGSTLILASYLSAMGISDDRIGLFMTLTLVGDVVISFFLTLFADAMGRKAVLSLGSVLMAGSGVIFALFGNFWILLAAAVFGVISPRFVFFVLWFLFIRANFVVEMKLARSVPWRNPLWLISHHMSF
jgi:predicted MFS family arabinose efflux permease